MCSEGLTGSACACDGPPSLSVALGCFACLAGGKQPGRDGGTPHSPLDTFVVQAIRASPADCCGDSGCFGACATDDSPSPKSPWRSAQLQRRACSFGVEDLEVQREATSPNGDVELGSVADRVAELVECSAMHHPAQQTPPGLSSIFGCFKNTSLVRSNSFWSGRSSAEASSQLPPRLRALTASSSRTTSNAARVHKGATVALLLPRGTAPPSDVELSLCGLLHPPDILGWYALTDGSKMALLQNDKRGVDAGLTNDGGWAKHGQARGLRHLQIKVLKLLESYVPAEKWKELRGASESDCHDVLAMLVPGARMWPLSDMLVSRVITLNIARERFRSRAAMLRLDRGPRFLDLMRMHYGEEVAFLFAWHSHYMHMLFLFVLFSVPFIIRRTIMGKGFIDGSMIPHSLLTIFFGVMVNSLWNPRVQRLVHRWHTHGDATARWHHLVVSMFEARAMVSRLKQPEAARLVGPGADEGVPENFEGDSDMSPQMDFTVADIVLAKDGPMSSGRKFQKDTLGRLLHMEQSAARACRTAFTAENTTCLDRFGRILKAMIVIPFILLEWCIILAFFTCIVWFEIWVIFDWGGCRDYNMQSDTEDWGCMSADSLRGLPGVVMGALPSICEGVFFELLLVVSKFTAHSLISLYHFGTREVHDFAVVIVIFLLEVVGKVGFISILGLGFVPTWSGRFQDPDDCRLNWDYWLMGEWSLGCLKGEIPFEVRLKLFESAMKGPMLVSGLIGILIKVLIPIILEFWRCGVLDSSMNPPRGCCTCRRNPVVRCLLAPTEFVLRTCVLFFQADFAAVRGLRILCFWPPKVSEEKLKRDSKHEDGLSATALDRAMQKLRRLQAVLLEGDRREHTPFDEYIELLLHFLWTSCFAIVWPLGTVFAMVNQLLEFRFDTAKILAVRRRRFPSTRHMSVAWVPHCGRIVSHVSIVVNVALLLLPYRQFGVELFDWPVWKIAVISVGMYLVYLAIYYVMRCLLSFAAQRWHIVEPWLAWFLKRLVAYVERVRNGDCADRASQGSHRDDRDDDLRSLDSLGMRCGARW